jgi:bifunctional DNA-binding transcriptional regulator/antitoxin component of YhaV-PrlF toxin-antitoxin module
MKNNQTMPQISLPADACKLSGFTDKDALELYAAKGVLVFLKEQMTALEVANAIESLSAIASDLTVLLASTCGICNNCGEDCADCDECQNNPAAWVQNCSLCHDLLDENQRIHIPDYLLEEAGIPADAKLEACTNEDSGEIMVTEADIQRDINDVPPGILSVLAASGICLAELDELIMLERIIHRK